MCVTIGKYFSVVATDQIKLVNTVLAVVHLNADLWTRKVSHQKFSFPMLSDLSSLVSILVDTQHFKVWR